MNKLNALVAVVMLSLAVISCSRIAERVSGTDKMDKAGDLWPDVPKMESLEASNLELPWAVKLLMKTALNNLWRFNKEGEDKTPVEGDWIAFTTKDPPADVQDFYSNDRMSSYGNWETSKDSTCISGKDKGADNGMICVFKKTDSGKEVLLAIWAGQDDKKTNVFYLRLEKPVESKSKE